MALLFVDSDYNGDSFFVHHAYFLGNKDPYERLRATLRADIDAKGSSPSGMGSHDCPLFGPPTLSTCWLPAGVSWFG